MKATVRKAGRHIYGVWNEKREFLFSASGALGRAQEKCGEWLKAHGWVWNGTDWEKEEKLDTGSRSE